MAVETRPETKSPMSEARRAIEEILSLAVETGTSDIHIKANSPPMFVLNGKVQRIDYPSLTNDQVKAMLYSIVTPAQVKQFETALELDASHMIAGVARFRLNYYNSMRTMGAVIRVIPLVVRTVDEMCVPPVLKRMTYERQGMILITGPTGSGKTTTLGSLIDYYNTTRAGHLVTIEDPIEVVHVAKRAAITQREVGDDTASFALAVKAALRQAPNVILVGEMRDRETIELALKAAETGHLVFSTLHTSDAVQTINRLLNAFPPHEQEQIRIQISNTLRACVAQRLVPRTDRPGRVAVLDILVNTGACRDLIFKNMLDPIYDLIKNGAFDGMQSTNQALLAHFRNGVIDYKTALMFSDNKTDLQILARNVIREMGGADETGPGKKPPPKK